MQANGNLMICYISPPPPGYFPWRPCCTAKDSTVTALTANLEKMPRSDVLQIEKGQQFLQVTVSVPCVMMFHEFQKVLMGRGNQTGDDLSSNFGPCHWKNAVCLVAGLTEPVWRPTGCVIPSVHSHIA